MTKKHFFRLLFLSLKYNLNAHFSNLPNLLAGGLGMLANNVIFLLGVWGLIFAGKSSHGHLISYFICLTSLLNLSFGCVNFFLGGLRDLATIITEGLLEPMLATPQSPLFLAAISRCHATALGDILTGILGIALLIYQKYYLYALFTLAASSIAILAYCGLFILTGALAFFIPRGNNFAFFLIEMTLGLSAYPTGKMLTGPQVLLLFFTPAYFTSILPMQAIENISGPLLGYAWIATCGFFLFSVLLFFQGVKRYQSLSLIGARF